MNTIETKPADFWISAYGNLPSRTIFKMLLMDDQSRPNRTQAMKQILSSPRIVSRRISGNQYIDVEL